MKYSNIKDIYEQTQAFYDDIIAPGQEPLWDDLLELADKYADCTTIHKETSTGVPDQCDIDFGEMCFTVEKIGETAKLCSVATYYVFDEQGRFCTDEIEIELF